MLPPLIDPLEITAAPRILDVVTCRNPSTEPTYRQDGKGSGKTLAGTLKCASIVRNKYEESAVRLLVLLGHAKF